MIALTVLGILCAALLPAILRTTPNQNKIMMKRSYYTTANIVSDMINNPNLYSPVSLSGVAYEGFDNLEEVTYSGETYGGSGNDENNGSYSKFIALFAAHMNIDGEISKTCPSSGDSGSTVTPGGSGSNRKYCRVYTTPDGVDWTLITTYKVETNKTINSIIVDVNGDKKPNCLQGDSDADAACKSRTENFDRFSMTISNDGTITIPEEQSWAREALQVSSSLTD